MNVGVSTIAPSTSGTLFIYRNGITSNEGNVTIENENIGGRQVVEYAGITTTLSAVISNATTSSIELQDILLLTLILVITY
jgi:hypothetical protein